MKIAHRNRPARVVPYLLLATILLAVISSCVINKYREARILFNDAARMENGIKLRQSLADELPIPDGDTKTASVMNNLTGVNAAYEESLSILQSITENEEAELRQNGMLGDKLALEAMCLLRLKRYGGIGSLLTRAKRLSNKAVREDATKRTRDSFLLEAMPGFIMNDQAFAKIPEILNPDKAKFDEVKDSLVGPGNEHALYYIRNARMAAAKGDNPVVLYLVITELAVYLNLRTAYVHLNNDFMGWKNSEERKKTKEMLACLKQIDKTKNKSMFKLWLGIFGFNDTKIPDITCDLTK